MHAICIATQDVTHGLRGAGLFCALTRGLNGDEERLLCVFDSVSVYLSVAVFVRLGVCLSQCLSVSVSVAVFVSVSVSIGVCV